MALLRPAKSPNLPIATNEYNQQNQNMFGNALRLYFNQIDSAFSNLLTVLGGKWLSFPYGAISRTTNVTAAVANTAYQITFNTNDYLNGMSNDGTDGIHVSQSGIYNYQFSIQFENSDASIQEATVWLKKNGANLAGTASIISVPNKHGSVNGYALAAANFYVSLSEGDYVELWWATTSTSVIMESYTASTSPYSRPSIPSVVATLSFVSSLPA